jgi:ABC-type cobalt transport system substrate-binding protein
MPRFTGQDGRARKIAKVGFGSDYADIFLPIFRQLAGDIERCPAET